MDALSRFWAANAIFLGIWEGAAIASSHHPFGGGGMSGQLPTISVTAARARKRWRLRTLVFLLLWSNGLVTYLYTKEAR